MLTRLHVALTCTCMFECGLAARRVNTHRLFSHKDMYLTLVNLGNLKHYSPVAVRLPAPACCLPAACDGVSNDAPCTGSHLCR